MEKTNQEYYVGIDMGTNSVGYAVTDENYHVLHYKKRAMWGVRLFDGAITAEDRRLSRTTRRRLGRRRWRIEMLQELFAQEICKVDPAFFQRMKDSMLWPEDKTEKQRFSLFNDEKYSDIDFYEEYPTIYHLRKALITQDGPFDIRLVYIALHHLVKHRGHFLFNGSVDKVTSFSTVFENFKICLKEELDIEIECSSEEKLAETLKDRTMSKRDKSKEVMELLNCGKFDKSNETQKSLKAIILLLCGMKAKLEEIFLDESLKDIDKPSISFSEGEYEDTRNAIEPDIHERCEIIDVIKTLYDWSVLADILEDGEYENRNYLSVAKVKTYEKHKKDLQLLKDVILKIGKEEYREFFRKPGKANYCAYIGYTIENGKKKKIKKCDKYEDFKKEILSIIRKGDQESPEIIQIMEELEQGTFLPLQVSKDNGVIPYQVNELEVRKILENAEKYLPFLKECDSEGRSVSEKIMEIFKFRIPYFVGPLNVHNNQNAWAVRREEGKILPWNLQDKIDFEKSGEKFIRRMTNKCTYLVGKDVIPQNSLLYSEFMVWNEINNIKVGGEKLPVPLKLRLFETIYKKNRNVKLKNITEFLKTEGVDLKEQALSGIDVSVKATLGSYHDFRKIFGEDINKYKTQQMVEQIINWLTVYCGDEKMLKKIIRKEYGSDQISDVQLSKIVRLHYKGWGRLSREFLDELQGMNVETGEIGTILYMLRNSNDNLMQLLSQRYTFLENIEKENAFGGEKGAFTYENLLGEVAASPATKRTVWQALLLLKEIVKIMGCQPKKIFVEMARGGGVKGRTTSRKDRLKELYKSIKDEKRDWIKEIDARKEEDFRSIKLYLYYTQMGKCMYTGKDIDLSDLADANVYDRDHIYPQSKTKDDSLDNLVLVDRRENAKKSDGMITPEIQQKMYKHWKYLRDKKFISEKKYERLMRKTPLTEEELAGFINRQVVETRQSTKMVTRILKECFQKSRIVYVKSEHASQLRKEELEMVKVRSLNDLHHAKDAYLNIVAGNVYDEKFTGNPLKWIREHREEKYSLNRMYDYDIIRGERVIWKRGKKGSIATVQEQMGKNDIQYTRYATTNKHGQNGGFFDQMPVSRKDNPGVPLKKGLSVEKYGGYKTVTPAYFALVESENKKGQKIRSIETVPLYLAGQFESGKASYSKYCEETLGLKNPRVILPRIKKDALLVVNKFPMHLRGTTGKQLLLQGAVQLCLPEEQTKYVKKIEKYIKRKTESKGKELPVISQWDGLTKEQNEELYVTLCGKLNNTIYQYRPNNQGKSLVENQEKFQELSCEEQCVVLEEILWFLRCKPKTSADLTLLGRSKNSGGIYINKTISGFESVILINQSVTGLFEKKTDLLKQ